MDEAGDLFSEAAVKLAERRFYLVINNGRSIFWSIASVTLPIGF